MLGGYRELGKCEYCQKCPLYNEPQVPAVGISSAEIMLIGEAPRAQEVAYGEPFVGRSGQILNSALEEAGIERAKLYITNAVSCRPPDNRTPTPEEIQLCRGRLVEEINQVKPKLIVTLGAVPMRSVLKLNGIVKHHGQEVYSEEFGCTVLPCYHPAFVLRDPRRQHEFLQDIMRIPRLIDDSKPKAKTEYIVVDSFEKLYQMRDDLKSLPAVAFDIETNGLNPFMEGANVTAISFSGQYGKSYCVPLYYQAPLFSSEFLGELATYLRNLSFSKSSSTESIPTKFTSLLQESSIAEELSKYRSSSKDYRKAVDSFIEELSSQRKYPVFSEEEINNLILPVLREILEDPAKELIAHNGKFDVQWLRYKHGFNIHLQFDTCIAHYLLDENSAHNLKQVASAYTDIGNYAHDFQAYEDRFNRAPEELFYQYSCADADATYRLYTVFKPLLAEKKLDKTFAMVMKFSESLTDVEYNGVKIDQEALAKLDQEMSKVLEDITHEIQTHTVIREWEKIKDEPVEFNPNSNDMVREVLFDCLHLPVVKKTKTSAPSVDAETLEELAKYHDLPELLLRYRKQSKLLGTYIRGYWKYMSSDGKIHPNFNLVVARTGRLSSSNPNLQNLPSGNVKDIKRLFIPSHPDWIMMNFDFSQIELRVMAMLSRDPVMTRVYQQGEDIHTMTAQAIFKKKDISKEERQMAKKLNFSILYGAGAEATARLLGVTPEEAQSFIQSYFKRYKGVAKYIKLVQQIAEKNGVVYSPYGRARRLPEAQMTTNESIKSKALREAVNHTIQSTASDICQIALAKINRDFKVKHLPANVILTVHDSIVVECHRDYMQEVYHLVKSHMEGVKGKFITIPLVAEAEWGFNYGDMFPYDGTKSFDQLMEETNKEAVA